MYALFFILQTEDRDDDRLTEAKTSASTAAKNIRRASELQKKIGMTYSALFLADADFFSEILHMIIF